ncbi:NAD(P)/FAD-dependent oxidoreductase [Candidatus Nitrospira bockiana]
MVIIGGGFGGLTAAQRLAGMPADITLVDRTNHHVFQPLLYQVATSALSAGDIASPLRTILRRSGVTVMMNEAIAVDRAARTVRLQDGELPFDDLVLAPGSRHSYFGHEQWGRIAPGLKTLADALEIRERMLLSFECAERVGGQAAKKHLTFVIVGGGPTGVELAGAIAEIARRSILPDFPRISPDDIQLVLLEAGDRILAGFDPRLSAEAQTVLEELGVDVRLQARVTEVTPSGVWMGTDVLESANIIWAAGNEASPLLRSLDAPLDRQGRVIVEKDLSIPGDSHIFVIGDAACSIDKDGAPLPALAPVAMQQARYVARVIRRGVPADSRRPFVYRDRGMLATIGKAHAVAQIGPIRTVGVIAWLLWSLVHIFFLIGFRNRLRVMFEWAWYYLTYRPGSRLIVGNKSERDGL